MGGVALMVCGGRVSVKMDGYAGGGGGGHFEVVAGRLQGDQAVVRGVVGLGRQL